jgi:YesN/AraC family two-component response regulator
VLIVDDDLHIHELYGRLIATALPPHRVLNAASVAAAQAMLADTVPALVVLDLTLPDVDGFALLHWLRQREALQHVPVLVVSSRKLSAEDIRQLDYPNVTFQPKHILAQQEAEQVLRRAYAHGCALPQATSALVRRALAYVQQHYHQALSRQEIAEAIGINKNYLSDVFHDELGVAPWEYLNRYRVHQAKDLLRNTNAPISEIAAQVGFDDSSYFGRVFHRYVGRSPRAYRQ